MTSVQDAYVKLGLEEGCTLEDVRASYKKLARMTHPDKDKSEGATKRFQELGSAYTCLQKHFERLENPSWQDDFYYSDDDDDDYEDEDNLQFFIFVFDEVFSGRSGRFYFPGRRGGFYPMKPRAKSPQETEEEYQERLRRNREERKAAAERREKEDKERKERKQREREKERIDAERRRLEKIAQKKADEEAARISREETLRAQKQRSQDLRSAIFAAARRSDTERVKKGVWEDNVEPDGGEIKHGCEEFVKQRPKDTSETLLHIATRLGNLELVQYLDKRIPEIERNSSGMTAFHIALSKGFVPIVKYFIDTYPPKDESYEDLYAYEAETVLRLSIRSGEPEIVWMILEFGLASKADISDAWTWFSSTKSQDPARQAKPDSAQESIEEISNLLMAFGGFTPPPTPKTKPQYIETKPKLNVETKIKTNNTKRVPSPAVQIPTPRATPSPSSESPQNSRFSGEGRGRGRGKGRGRGRGRGSARS